MAAWTFKIAGIALAAATSVGALAQLFDQTRDGVADIPWTVLGYTPGRFYKTEVFERPFITGLSSEASSRALAERVQNNAMDEFKDVQLLAVHTHGPGLFHTEQPVTGPESLRGMKIRGGTRIVNNMLVKHHTTFAGQNGLYGTTFALSMNKAVYNKLPADLKKVMDNKSDIETAALFGRVMDAGDKIGRDLAVKAGNKVTVLEAAEVQRWRRTAGSVEADWLSGMQAKNIDGARSESEARTPIAKNEK